MIDIDTNCLQTVSNSSYRRTVLSFFLLSSTRTRRNHFSFHWQINDATTKHCFIYHLLFFWWCDYVPKCCFHFVFVFVNIFFFFLSCCSRESPLGDVRLSVWIAFNRLSFGSIVNLCSRTPILSHIRTYTSIRFLKFSFHFV